MDSNYSLSDLATITNGGGIGGGNGIWLLIILFFLVSGCGFGWNNRGGDYGQYDRYATAASQQEILFNQHFNNLDNKMDRGFTSIGNGISDATFALTNSIVGEGRATQAAVGQNRFDMANYNAGILSAIHDDGEKTRNMIQQNKIETLQAQVNELKTAQMFCGLPRINPNLYNVVPNCGCGCGNNAI